jgi:hypothetical protein
MYVCKKIRKINKKSGILPPNLLKIPIVFTVSGTGYLSTNSAHTYQQFLFEVSLFSFSKFVLLNIFLQFTDSRCPFAYSVYFCRKRNGSGSFGGAYESEEEIAYVGLGVNVYVFQSSTWYLNVLLVAAVLGPSTSILGSVVLHFSFSLYRLLKFLFSVQHSYACPHNRVFSSSHRKLGSVSFTLFATILHIAPVFRIRIRIHRIHVFLGLPDPDPLVRGMDPDPNPALDPDPSIIKQIY